ncbi:spermidine/putrescine ABC transporter ATP-binding protein [Alsobacter metallidurans]|uniref:Spermidine/putrescine ABC transporter ATP-binding protein n=1 Tax=Alsobacter metallidurans TaxID=340221 RepID=A0A917I5C1_9HYPH|nr:ABC transporter ATP-binding protein [Alsobacter metallidurans]GGH16293.1 spermidine/putrescine ABC transporter ATP-binding protein [Alsobacter metallidurans]
MARLILDRVSKSFGDVQVLQDVSIDVRDGEFLAILGPSGCGKTTLLRLIAGFERVTSGEIRIGEKTVSAPNRHVPPEDRQVGIVFQSYALWPHMTVAQNVGYSQRVLGASKDETRKKVAEALGVVGLGGFEDRSPSKLSGGQRQRVALARCLVQSPNLVLLDEPLANLDVHLRASMEDEFSDFHRRSGSTMVYITHDQAEAMAMADRIAVMDRGRLAQLATPAELHDRPATEMIASFIGGGMVLDAEMLASEADGRCVVRLYDADVKARCARRQAPGRLVKLALYPNALSPSADGRSGVACHVTKLTYLGGRFRVEVAPDRAPSTRLFLHVDEVGGIEQGAALRVAVGEGWVIPHAEGLAA